MQGLAPSDIFLFEDFRLDRCGGVSRRDDAGAYVPVTIGSRALSILGVLIDRAGEVVAKDEIIAAVWPTTVVEDSNLTVQISALRRVLDRGRLNGSCIQTVPGRGYRFVALVTRRALEAPSPALPYDGGAERGNQQGRSPFVAPRLSIVVLPFANLSNDLEQQYFADAMTEDVTSDLSRIGGMLVISRNTAFTFRNRTIDTRQIGRELSVRYVLEGSVRRSDNQIRINAQLIDAENDAHLWAERFDRGLADLFALQDEITSRIAITLSRELVRADAARPTQNPDALDYFLRGRVAMAKPPSCQVRAEQVSWFERTLALDPQFVDAQSWLAIALAARVADVMSDAAADDTARAEELALRALAASPQSYLAHHARGQVLRVQRRFAEAIPEYETALALNRNWVGAIYALGQCNLFTGSIEATIPLVEQAMRLSPRDHDLGIWYQQIAAVHLLQSRVDEAIVWLERSRNAIPTHPAIRAYLASAYALGGETEGASAELAEAQRLSSDDRYTTLARLRSVVSYWGVPKVRALFEATYFAGLRRAGMPQE